jgi:ABC-type uncharacterized transport system fused permease/ATPase subunit
MNNVVLIIIAIAAVFVVDIVFGDVLSPTAKSIVTGLTLLLFAFIYVFGQCAAGSAVARLHKLGEQLDTEQQSQAVETEKQSNHKTQTRKEQEEKLHKLAASGKAKIVIDGEPTSDEFDIDGIRLKDYDIKFKNGKVYLISK